MSQPIHITVIAPYQVFPARTGGQKNISSFYEHLAALAPLTMVSTKRNDAPAGFNIEFLKILNNSSLRYLNIFLFFSIRKIIRERKSTHLFIEHPYYGWLALLLKWSCKVKLVIHSHNIEATRFRSIKKWWWGILWNYEKFTHRRADINFFITNEDKQYAIAHYKLNYKKCHTITYGIYLQQPPSREDKLRAAAILRKTHHIAEEEKNTFL